MSTATWTQQQLTDYRQLSEACARKPWTDVAALCFPGAQMRPPAADEELRRAESALACPFPPELRSFYEASNGLFAYYADVVFPVAEAVADTIDLRTNPGYPRCYMPFTHMLVFGGDGGGDRFFYPIMADGSIGIERSDTFVWCHETDSRSYYANSLRDLFVRFSITHEFSKRPHNATVA